MATNLNQQIVATLNDALPLLVKRVAKTVGANLKARRDALGYTQAEIARALSIDRSLVSQYETATVDIPLSRLVAFSALFSTPLPEFFDTESTGVAHLEDANATLQMIAKFRQLLDNPDLQERLMELSLDAKEAPKTQAISKTF